MLKVAEYKRNTFIIVQSNKPADRFYIIRLGKVRVTTNLAILSSGNDVILGPGDFFGVVSALSGHAYMEQALCIENVSLILVSRVDLTQLITKNVAVAFKMIRFFSLRLRVIDRAMEKFGTDSHEESPESLYHIGLFYYTKREEQMSSYAFKRYLTLFPNGQYSASCKKCLEEMSQDFSEAGLAEFVKEQNLENKKERTLTCAYQKGDIIFLEYEPGYEVYIIQSGYIKITKKIDNNEVLFAILQSGDIFGEMALLENKPRSASAICHVDAVLLTISRENFQLIVQQQPRMTDKLLVLLSERIWVTFQQLANLVISDPLGRLYDMLLTLALKKKAPLLPGNVFEYDVGAEELTKMVGLSPEEVESSMLELLKVGNIRLNGGNLVCVNLEELEKQASFYRKRAIQEISRNNAKS